MDLVSLISLNLKRVAYPLESRREGIDYPMMRQFEQALLPPEPLRALEAGPSSQANYPWRMRQRQLEATHYTEVTPSMPYNQNGGPFDQNESPGLLSQRLQNLSMRRVETIDSVSSCESRQSTEVTVEPLIQRLQDMRNQIIDAVGIRKNTAPQIEFPPSIEPQRALLHELEAWDLLEDRIRREILHPGHLLAHDSQPSISQSCCDLDSIGNGFKSNRSSIQMPVDIPSALGTSPTDRHHLSSHGSPDSNRDSFQLPLYPLDSPVHGRTFSTSSSSPAPSIRLTPAIPVYL